MRHELHLSSELLNYKNIKKYEIYPITEYIFRIFLKLLLSSCIVFSLIKKYIPIIYMLGIYSSTFNVLQYIKQQMERYI